MNRTLLILVVAFLSIFISNAQDLVKKEGPAPGLSFSAFGNYGPISLGGHNEDYPEFSSNSFYSPGISFFFKTKKMAEIETGIYYSFHSINIDHNYPAPGHLIRVRTIENIELIEIPLNVRFDLPFFYASTGLLFDCEIKNSKIINEQTGIGFNSGLGVSYKFTRGILVYAGPVIYIHTIFPLDKDKLTGISLKAGIAFN